MRSGALDGHPGVDHDEFNSSIEAPGGPGVPAPHLGGLSNFVSDRIKCEKSIS